MSKKDRQRTKGEALRLIGQARRLLRVARDIEFEGGPGSREAVAFALGRVEELVGRAEELTGRMGA